jgi:anti-sigma factor RsiW
VVRVPVEPRCADVRRQLALGERGELRRAALRRHLRSCPACAEFREEVRRQRALIAKLLPVAPSAALRRSVLAASRAPTQGLGTASSSQSASSPR